MAESIHMNLKRIFSVSVLLTGQYGIEGVTLSLPAVIGVNGIERILAPELSKKNAEKLAVSAGKIRAGLAESKSMDFMHASPLRNYHSAIIGTSDYRAIEDSDVIVFTAGIARRPGMDRMDLLKTNVNIARQAAQNIARYAPNAIVIAVSNPLDIIANVFLKETGFALKKVVGMTGVLDSTRFRYFIAEALDVSAEAVKEGVETLKTI